ncbi:MAG TPA: ABC transporter permease [Phycisphaerae bacterium]|nr:ABC transporter permease [Phycisphaerae bacterium]HPM22789.1 ABC transporter permease [Phycisphaerae bacterium]
MSPLTVIAESLHSLGKNKVRTALSILGIVIGIGAVIAMVAVATGAQRKVEREIAAIGDDWLTIWYMGETRGGVHRDQATPLNMTRDDAEAIVRECPAVRAASPTNRVPAQVISQYGNYRSGVMGVYPSFFDIRRWNCSVGRCFDYEEMAMNAKVCCIGSTAARELFGAVPPVGQTIRVNRVAFEVIGLLESKGVGSDGRDFDDIILFPFTSFQRLIAGNEPSGTLFAAAKPGVPLAEAKKQIRDLLRQRRRLGDTDEDTFRIMDRSLMAQANAEATRTFNLLLTSIASISLIVGGVGIMNIMLVSVTERTREIGLRMAIGANGLHVLGQFLCEAVVLCAIGGLFGFAAGWGVANVVSQRLGWETEVSYWMAAVAIAFATGVGLFFGFYPAWRASRLNPIDALRFE